MTRTLFVHIELMADVVQTAASATEGAHHSLDCIRGATLLGAVAAANYERLGAHAFTAFHSGRVRFGDAQPLVEGHPALPAPLAWYRTKRSGNQPDVFQVLPGGSKDGAHSEWKQVREGRFTEPAQGLPLFHRTTQRFRLKTAVDRDRGGRPQDAMLFGYESLPAGSTWLARVDIDDDVPNAVRDVLYAALHEKDVWLGRSRAAEYGRAKTTVLGRPPASKADPSGKVRQMLVHCVSDLMLVDRDSGQPTLTPTPSDFQLPQGWCYRPERSDMRTFRYSPFHGKRKRRDLERLGIQRGSVLNFEASSDAQEVELAALRQALERGVGICRAEGFGEVRVAPWYLQLPDNSIAFSRRSETDRKQVTTPNDPLARWMEEQFKTAAHEGKTLKDADGEAAKLFSLWSKAKRDKKHRPSVTQWQRVVGFAAAALRAEPLSAQGLKDRILDEMKGVAANDWRSEIGQKTFQKELLGVVDKPGHDRERILRTLLTAKLVARRIGQGTKTEANRT